MIERKKLEKIIDVSKINSEREVLDKYSSDFSFVSAVKPDFVVKPRTTKEVEELIKLANQTSTPLVPISSGPPHLRGDTVPGIGGAIIVDLSGMKKIIRIDRNNRVANCEAGVTFGELSEAVKKVGLRLNMPLLPKQSKSVIASMLEREPVTMPGYHWDSSDPLGCIEVVFGTGDMFRTGAAAGPGTIEEQWAAGQSQNEAAGPSQFSLSRVVQGAQGTMGIVTWASLRCELMPKIEEPFIVGSAQLGKLVELVYWLVRLRLVNECFILNSSNMAAILAKNGLANLLELKSALPAWILFFNIAGYEYLPEERVQYQKTEMMNSAQRLGIEVVKTIGKVSASELLELIQTPCPEPYWKLRYKGAVSEIFFLTTSDKIGDYISIMNDTANEIGYPASDIGVYIQPVVQGTNYHCEFDLFYDPHNAGEFQTVKRLSSIATKKLLAKGAFFSRPYGENAGMIMNRDAATMNALNKVKTILDPNNIMNPGKLCF